MACSNIRYGPGVTQEVGMDLANMGAKKVGVYTDKNLAGMLIIVLNLQSSTFYCKLSPLSFQFSVTTVLDC